MEWPEKGKSQKFRIVSPFWEQGPPLNMKRMSSLKSRNQRTPGWVSKSGLETTQRHPTALHPNSKSTYIDYISLFIPFPFLVHPEKFFKTLPQPALRSSRSTLGRSDAPVAHRRRVPVVAGPAALPNGFGRIGRCTSLGRAVEALGPSKRQ